MGDTLSAIGGFALIIGLFVAYAIQRRNARIAKNPPPAAEPAAAPVAAVDAATAETPLRSSRSPNWGAPILFCLLLLGAATHRGNFWGYLWQTIFFAFVAVALYSMFSAKDFEIEKKRDPELTRSRHYLTIGVPYVLFPVIGWVVTIPMGINGGFLIPAVAWAPLILIGVGFATFQKAREIGGRK